MPSRDSSHLGQIVLENLNDQPDNIIQIDAQTGQAETRRSLRKRSIRFARHMQKFGLKVNDIVIVCAYNHNDTVLPMLAGFYIGVAVNGLDMKMSKLEYAHIMKITKPKLIFCEPSIAEVFAEVRTISGCEDAKIVTFGDTKNKKFIPIKEFYHQRHEDSFNFQVVNFDPATTYAYIVCSSGSTGLPKGVCHTHSSAVSQIRDLKSFYNGYIMIQFSSIYWLSGLAMTLLNVTIHTIKINALPFTPELFFEYCPKYKPNLVMITPSVVRMLINHPGIATADLSSMKLFMVAGATVDFEELSIMKKYITNGHVINSYGLSEAGGPVTYTLKTEESKRGSCGKINPAIEYKVIDIETKKELKEPNKQGELYLKSSSVMFEYFNNPNETANAITDDGWLKTGDLVKIDDDGYLYIVDRLKDFFKYMGYGIAPATLESVINSLPGVEESAVIGIDNKDSGHVPIAFVKKTEGSTVTAEDIKRVVIDNLAFYCALRGGVVFVDKFEMTPSGKLKRNVLKNLLPNCKIE